jgi:hypothetical protein
MPTVKLYDGKRYFGEHVDADNTVAAADSGVVLNVIADGKKTTLPDAAAGNLGVVVIVRLGGVPAGGPVGSGANKSVAHEIAPHSSDKIVGLGAAGTADKSLLMAKDDMIVGDYVKLQSDGAGAWNVLEAVGAWTREA